MLKNTFYHPHAEFISDQNEEQHKNKPPPHLDILSYDLSVHVFFLKRITNSQITLLPTQTKQTARTTQTKNGIL